MENDPELLSKYDETFKKQKELGIIERQETPGKIWQTHYLPHHGIVCEDKDTTKLRIVFDASSKICNVSLNNCLLKGPNVIPLMFDIILRFRFFPIAITADTEKAFLQIGIKETDRDYLRFLWVDDILKENPKIIRNRSPCVVFGVTSSPFLSNVTIRKHNTQYTTAAPGYVQKTLLSFFIDDFTGGEFSIDSAFELYKKLKLRFLEGHFSLRKWRTNNKTLREKINETESISEKVSQNSKILGFTWDEEKDAFIFDFAELAETASKHKPTKGNILSVLSSFYDPTRFIQPLTVTMKVLFKTFVNLK